MSGDQSFEGYEARLREMVASGASEQERIIELGKWLERHREILSDPEADIYRDLARVKLKLAAGFMAEAKADLFGIREGDGVLAKATALHDADKISDGVMDAIGDVVGLLRDEENQ